jgi:magnesium-transporting ATPase (P-type)
MPNIFMSGEELKSLHRDKAYDILRKGGVIYRALPETKLYLVELYQNKGKLLHQQVMA